MVIRGTAVVSIKVTFASWNIMERYMSSTCFRVFWEKILNVAVFWNQQFTRTEQMSSLQAEMFWKWPKSVRNLQELSCHWGFLRFPPYLYVLGANIGISGIWLKAFQGDNPQKKDPKRRLATNRVDWSCGLLGWWYHSQNLALSRFIG